MPLADYLPVSGLSRLGFWLVICLNLCLFYVLGRAVYNAAFHPLAIFPGPGSRAISQIPQILAILKGTHVYEVSDLHKEYGPVVRTRPNELSYITADALKDIYSLKAQLPKYDSFITKLPHGTPEGLFLSTSSEDHARMRRNINPGFSEKALREQEPRIMKYVDLLMKRLVERAGKEPLDICSWYNFTTFDIIGELFFGESFSCLEHSTSDDWIESILPYLKFRVLLRQSNHFPPLDKILAYFIPQKLRNRRAQHMRYTSEKLKRRLARENGPIDFLSYAQPHIDTPQGFTSKELLVGAGTFIVAGSETSATTLTAATYFLLLNPASLQKLLYEIRSSFKVESDITMISVIDLKYLTAVLNESLRLLPAAAGISLRLTTSQSIICGKVIPTGTAVGVSQYAAYHSPNNFTDSDEFVPERWLGDSRYKDDNFAVFQPFSYGPRNCIGQSLAYAEMRVILAKLLWNFDLELCKESRDWMREKRIWLMWEKKPLMVKLIAVKG